MLLWFFRTSVPGDECSSLSPNTRFPTHPRDLSIRHASATYPSFWAKHCNVRSDGVVHVYAKYSTHTEDGTIISVTNEGYGRSSQEEMKGVFASDYNGAPDASSEWYTKTWPRFDVEAGKHEWLGKSCFLGELLRPDRPGHVKIEVYEIL
ncbi:hypothetical protein KVT40_002202 [Elsinoe batatas]|uniref:Uncharacterized protein n=1 Tax=Elsinoe batatas TaxID=2601811 RepID=A0A8K0PKG1_9PEZI|nr:hypothetical protein KVT40_002202 [Elsinoe batatas]